MRILNIAEITERPQPKLRNSDCLTLDTHETNFRGSISTLGDSPHNSTTMYFEAMSHIEVPKDSWASPPLVAWLRVRPKQYQDIIEQHLMFHSAAIMQRPFWLIDNTMKNSMRAFQHLDRYFDFKRCQLDLSDTMEEMAGDRDHVVSHPSTSPHPPSSL